MSLFMPTICLYFLLLLCHLNLMVMAFAHSHSVSHSLRPRCHFDESWALLQFKESFVMSSDCSNSKLASWKLHGQRGDCCSWEGVECDEKTNHVISLNLSSSCLFGSINSSSTLFLLVHLRRLNLAFNDFNSSHIPPQLAHLSMLTHLNLSSSGFSGQIPPQISDLSNLVSLDLSAHEDLQLHELSLKISLKSLVQKLLHLKELDLSYVNISSGVPQLLEKFSSLESLQLVQCGLQGEFPVGIFQLPKLKMLDISGNSDLKVHLPDFHGGIHLISLRLSDVKFVGEIPSSIGNLANLEEFEISYCNFTGQLPSSLGNLTNLTLLDLSNNHFAGQGDSFSWVGKLTKLNILNLCSANLNGNIPSYLVNLTQLYYLDLGYSNLTGPIPHWLMNLTQLAYVFLDHNQLNGKIPSWLIYGNNIEILFLASNQLSGQIPSVNNTLSPLFHLDLSSNKLQGTIPSSLFKLENLILLELHSNNLVGTVNISNFFQPNSLMVLSLSFNNLWLLTDVPANAKVQNFLFLGLASCNLSEFPSFLHSQDELKFLDLSSNNIHGQIPSWVWEISPNSLEFMNLSYNSLSGFEKSPYPVVLQWAHLRVLDLRSNMLQEFLSVPVSSYKKLKNGCKLKMINLSQNQIQGKVPRSLADCTALELLDLSNNKFIDNFPSWLGTLPGLRILILRSNGFYGVIEKDEVSKPFTKLQIIDLSSNHFTGSLPSIYFENWNTMKVAEGSHIRYMGKNQEFTPSAYYTNYDYSIKMNNKGLQIEYLKIPNALVAIDFSHNRFEGEIPNSIGSLTGLHLLNLSSNILTGEIPLSLVNLKELECLDLSANKIKGEIPPQLAQLTFLSSFNVAFNQLEGPIPRENQFNTFDEKSYQGNLELCGVPLTKKCGNVDELPPSPSEDENFGSPFEFGWKVVLYGYGSGFVIGAVIGHIITRKKQGWFVKTFGVRRRRRRQTRNRNRN